MTESSESEYTVTCQTGVGTDIRDKVLRTDHHQAVFERSNAATVLQASEVLPQFTIRLGNRTLYFGRAVVRKLIDTGSVTICEAALEELWTDPSLFSEPLNNQTLREGFGKFQKEWHHTYRILPEFKTVIADMEGFLHALRTWLEQVELRIRAAPDSDPRRIQLEVMESLVPLTTPVITQLFERFETVAATIETDAEAVHQAFGRRHLHPLLLSSPFVYRTFSKPLGFAGDYEMVNMMMRHPCEGSTLFANTVNAYALTLPPIVAHRNRIEYLAGKLKGEALRLHSQKQRCRVLNLGCGPAWELQRFLQQTPLADGLDVTLIDFNDETLEHVNRVLSHLKRQHGRMTDIHLLKRSVQQMLKQASRPVFGPDGDRYDFIYCAGLFDYLSDAVCHALTNYLFARLRKGGLLLVTNVNQHPNRREMEYFLEWHLIYRDAKKLAALAPAQAHPEDIAVIQEATGVNQFLEVRHSDRD